MGSLLEKRFGTRGMSDARALPFLRSRRADLFSCFLIVAAAILIGCLSLNGTGTLWPDGPQYANAGVMFHDWLLSGDLLHPYQFAAKQYAQYPAFHLPFHPPAYPLLLGIFFLLTGVSYASARLFVALCLGVAGCFFYALTRRMGTGRAVAFVCALVLLTMPEITRWSRDTMSEVPALAFILAGSYFFIRWFKSEKTAHCLLAFGFAEVAFLSRVTTAGVIPAWFLFILLTGQWRKLRSLPLVALSAVYLCANIAWTIFASRFAKYETGLDNTANSAGHSLSKLLSMESVSFYLTHLPSVAGWLTLIAALCGLAVAFRRWRQSTQELFWIAWLITGCGFLLALRLVPEPRYLFFILPALPGLASVLAGQEMNQKLRTVLVPTLLVLCILVNVYYDRRTPAGVVGYEAVARTLAAQPEATGNIMSLAWMNQDFIFRYQANHPSAERRIIRGDRTLAIRLSNYGGFSGAGAIEPVILAHNTEEVLSFIQRGRVRYLITCAPEEGQKDDRTPEMLLAHDVARSLPESFALVGKYPLLINFDHTPFRGQLFVWKFTGELPNGPSELPVVVPTADMVIH